MLCFTKIPCPQKISSTWHSPCSFPFDKKTQTVFKLKQRRRRKMKKMLGLAMVFGLILVLGSAAMAQQTTTVDVTANVVGTCRFTSGGTMAFGALDPAVGNNVNAGVTQPTFWCTRGASYTISDDNGLWESGSNHQVRHETLVEYIPYTFTYTATGSGNGPANPITMDIAGTILGADYLGASSGNYADTVTLSIIP
jgi:spore coat protein U-like protein